MSALTLHRSQSPQQTERCRHGGKEDGTFTDRSNGGFQIWTHSVFSSWSGLETCTLLFPHGLSLSPLSGSQQGDIVNWLYNKEKRIMHTCWYSVLFFSCPFVCARWFEVHMDLTVSFYCLLQLSSPFMGEKKMSMCRFTALCVSQFKMLQCLES